MIEIESMHTTNQLNPDEADHSCEEPYSRNEINVKVSRTESSQSKHGKFGPFSWSLLPIILSVTSAVGLVTTCFIAKSNCHIERWIIPYVSYAGTENPESMVFGLILNTEGFLGIIVVYLAWRYYRQTENCPNHVSASLKFLNHVSLVLGMLSCFGVIMVGNFQVAEAKAPHYIGAGLAFIIGTAYAFCTSIMSRQIFKLARPKLKYGSHFAAFRFVVAVVMSMALICVLGVGMYKIFNKRDKTGEIDPDIPIMWPNGTCQEMLSRIPESVRSINLFGAVTEWLVTGCLLMCLSLFAYEFNSFESVKVAVRFVNIHQSNLTSQCDRETPSSQKHLLNSRHCDTVKVA